MTSLVDILLLVLLATTGIAVIRTRNLFVAAMLAGIYSLVSAGLFVVMDAVDVAFTEAAVGAGISTVLLLGTLALVGHKERGPQRIPLLPLAVVLVIGGILIYGTSQMPPFGGADNPAHLHIAPYYIEGSRDDIHIPNVVTTVLGSYRGFDTMGETAVIFTAMVGVLLLLSRGPLPRRVFHEGRWITVRPRTTREDLQAVVDDEGSSGAGEGTAGADLGAARADGGAAGADEGTFRAGEGKPGDDEGKPEVGGRKPGIAGPRGEQRDG